MSESNPALHCIACGADWNGYEARQAREAAASIHPEWDLDLLPGKCSNCSSPLGQSGKPGGTARMQETERRGLDGVTAAFARQFPHLPEETHRCMAILSHYNMLGLTGHLRGLWIFGSVGQDIHASHTGAFDAGAMMEVFAQALDEMAEYLHPLGDQEEVRDISAVLREQKRRVGALIERIGRTQINDLGEVASMETQN